MMTSEFLEEVRDAVLRARVEHRKNMASPHDAYGVILEEVDEFWDEVKAKTVDRVAMRIELIHIAAMACRAAVDLEL